MASWAVAAAATARSAKNPIDRMASIIRAGTIALSRESAAEVTNVLPFGDFAANPFSWVGSLRDVSPAQDTRLRIAAIGFLNPAPLMWDFEHPPLSNELALRYRI